MTSTPTRTTATRTVTAACGGLLLASHPTLMAAIAAFVAVIFFGIALPAVWSAKHARRAAALKVLSAVLAVVSRCDCEK